MEIMGEDNLLFQRSLQFYRPEETEGEKEKIDYVTMLFRIPWFPKIVKIYNFRIRRLPFRNSISTIPFPDPRSVISVYIFKFKHWPMQKSVKTSSAEQTNEMRLDSISTKKLFFLMDYIILYFKENFMRIYGKFLTYLFRLR